MYAFGDQKNQLPESINLMNALVVEYMEGMTREAMASSFDGKLSPESLQFAIRKDQRKADRVQQLLVMYQKVIEERNMQLKDKLRAAPPVVTKASTTSGSKKRKASGKQEGGDAKRPKAKAKTKTAAPAQPKSAVSSTVDKMLNEDKLKEALGQVDVIQR